MGLRDEILEQPKVHRRLIDEGWDHVRKVAAAIRRHEIDHVLIAARGTSDHAGLYAKYLWGAFNGLPVAMATPSLFTLYHKPPRLHRTLVVGISQSGQSPDINAVLDEGRLQGALTLALTNDPESPLAANSDLCIDVQAGPEEAIAATKSYTAQLMVVAMLSAAWSGEADQFQALQRVPEFAWRALEQEEEVARITERYRFMEQCVVIGRGFNYATAYEWSLKLKELAYVVSEPYSSADFRHGPIAMVAQGFPVLAIAVQGPVYSYVLALLRRLKDEHEVELLTVSDHPEALALGDRSFPLPEGMAEWITPIISILPAQLFCYHLTHAKRLDVESPRGLTKVTKTH